MDSIYDLSWHETSFFAKLQLFFQARKRAREQIRSRRRKEQAEGYSQLSSTYYSIVGTAYAQLRAAVQPRLTLPWLLLLWTIAWLPLAGYCYWRMLPLSDRVQKLIGYAGMTADQCDVRQSILRAHRKFEPAKRCIYNGLKKNPMRAHTRGLLRLGLAEVCLHQGLSLHVEQEMQEALQAAAEAEREDPLQAARIYTRSANLLEILKQDERARTNDLRHKAHELASAANAADPLLKQA
jgi:hypothetical protein